VRQEDGVADGAGLEDITDGTLRIGGCVVNDVSPKDRDIAMIFQNYALYQDMTVAENIGFALRLRRIGPRRRSRGRSRRRLRPSASASGSIAIRVRSQVASARASRWARAIVR
jgi:ABC-type sugar transport system ATPase subunit